MTSVTKLYYTYYNSVLVCDPELVRTDYFYVLFIIIYLVVLLNNYLNLIIFYLASCRLVLLVFY